MLLKSDWFAIAIATVGVGIVIYLGWDSRHENPIMKKIIYTLLGLMAVLWILIATMLTGNASA
jgi:NADH:ubiquinone oxidoreductase subunit 4 (subunit M)